MEKKNWKIQGSLWSESLLNSSKVTLNPGPRAMYGRVWGTTGKLLTPGSPPDRKTSRFLALISVGGANRFLEDLSPDIPRNQLLGKVVETKLVQHVKLGWFKVFPDIQDHLGEFQPLRHQGVGQEQGLPQWVNFWENCINNSCLGLFRMIIMAILRCFWTARTIWVKSSLKDTKV